MKPRTPTVAARFQESLSQLLGLMSQSHPHFVRCIKPNADKTPMKFDMPLVLEQLRYMGMLETIKIRKIGKITPLLNSYIGVFLWLKSNRYLRDDFSLCGSVNYANDLRNYL